MNWKSLVVTFVLALGGVAAVGGHAGPVHTFHTSLMKAEYNQKEQLVEISIQVFLHDLETALSRRSGKNINLEKSPGAAQLTLAYLNDMVNIKNHDGRIKTLSWIGMEPKADAVWLYVEAKMPEGFEDVEVRNRILFELFDDQVNRVQIKDGEKICNLVFKPGDNFKLACDAR